jgi:hypothetical protein
MVKGEKDRKPKRDIDKEYLERVWVDYNYRIPNFSRMLGGSQ